jgi:hypothetical protein
MENSNQAKYGSLSKGLNSKKSLGHDHYPRTISEANNVLSNHNLDEIKTSTNHIKMIVRTTTRKTNKIMRRLQTKHQYCPLHK